MDKTATKPTSEASTIPTIFRTVKTASIRDLRFVVSLQRRWSNTVGFLPACTHQRYIEAGHVLIVLENDEPAGFLNFTITTKGLLRLPQVAIHPDLLRTTLGSKVMRTLIRHAERNQMGAIRLTSRSDLQANIFWPTLGFKPTAILTPRTRRNKPHIEWTLQLSNTMNAVLMSMAHGVNRNEELVRPPTDDEIYAITKALP